MSNIHLSIYPESKGDVIKGVLDFIRANNYPELYHRWFDSDRREDECLVSSCESDEIDAILAEKGLTTFHQIKGINDVVVDKYDCYRFNNGKYYIITF
jgi:hypothetical protein